jgi:O-Antigen ligase/Phospholipase/Carboxylesterase
MYQYLGNLRLQLWFDNPNICAIFLCMTIFITLSFQQFFFYKNKLYCKIFSLVIFCTIAFQMFLLARTYSRGGYIAMFGALCFVWYLSKSKLFPSCLLIFCGMILFINNGIERLSSVTKTSDGSILHRFLLWEGGTGIIANNFISGVLPDYPGVHYALWYQPLWLDERYSILINDYLTIGASYGLFVVFGYLSGILLLLWLGIRVSLKGRNQIIYCLLGAIISYLIGASFSAFYEYWSVYWFFWLLMTILLIVIIVECFRKRFKITKFDIAIPVTLAFSICIVVFFLGTIVNARLPYTFKKIRLQDKGIEIHEAHPQYIEPKANIIYLFNPKNKTLREEIRFTVRPLLLQGFAVFAAEVDSSLSGLGVAKQVIKYSFKNIDNDKPVFIIGCGDGAKHGLIAAVNMNLPALKGIVAIGMPATWPWDEISPISQVSKLKVPLLLIHGENDNIYPVSESILLKKFCDKNKLPVHMKIVSGTGHYFDKKRNILFASIDNFTKTD